MTRTSFHACRLIFALFLSVVAGDAAGQITEKESKKGQAAPAIKVIELAGEPAEIGRAHGTQLGQQVRLLQDQYLKRWFLNDAHYRQAQAAAFVFRNQLLPEHRDEISALAEASGIGAGDIMLGNCFLDLLPVMACSTVTLPAEASPDGVARFGRNLDFPGMNVADKHSVVLVFRPKERYAFAAVSWPGLIGVLSGMNEHGLALANMEVRRLGVKPQAMPYTLLYRTVLERCKTVDEAIELLKKTPKQSANNLMLMDAAGNRAVVEITPKDVVVRRAEPKAALISTNHHRGADQATPGRCRRYDRLSAESVASFGRIDVPAIEKMLDSVSQGRMTLQSMVFEPSSRVIYLATGAEATKRAYQKIELAHYFNS